jgi:hypothetical protein
MSLTAEDRQKLRERCSVVLPGFRTPPPAEEFRLLADWRLANEVAHDVCGEGRLIGSGGALTSRDLARTRPPT